MVVFRSLFVLLMIGVLPFLAAVNGTDIRLRLQVTGHAETVYAWRRDRCDADQIPDSPARAFRTADGQVRLMAGHYTNQFFVGPDLGSVRPECRSSFRAPMDRDAEQFNARTWLQTFFTEDGVAVFAIGSADYHGSWFGQCAGANPLNNQCWRSAIVLAMSADGGRTFTLPSPPAHVIARPPTPFAPNESGRPRGFFTTSNIVKRSGRFQMFAFTFGYPGQKPGNCLLQSDNLRDPRSWRAWNGGGFEVSFNDRIRPEDAEHPAAGCLPVAGLSGPVRALLRHDKSGLFVSVFAHRFLADGPNGKFVRVEFRYATSSDLLHWSKSGLLLAHDASPECKNTAVATVSYPSLLDPKSTDRNFGTLGDSAYLYFTRFNASGECKMNLDRDLVRVPVKISG